MSVDVHDPTTDPGSGASQRPRERRWAAVLLAAAAWNVWLWVTRAWNLANDPTPRTTGFVVVHAVLYVVSFAFAVAIGVIGWRLWQRTRGGGRR